MHSVPNPTIMVLLMLTMNSNIADVVRSCCPWIYSAFFTTARSGLEYGHTPSYDMCLLLDDFEICKSDLGKVLKVREIELFQPNETLPEQFIQVFRFTIVS
jgi:hypothetical protein